MTWPTYFPPDATLPPVDTAPLPWRPVIRHDMRQRETTTQGGPQTFGVAVDVWRDGLPMWRSWSGEGEDLIDWTLRELGPDAPANYDEGLWGVPGVVDVFDHPIPTPACTAPVHGLQAVSDFLYTVPAIALQGHHTWPTPEGFESPPSMTVLRARLNRSERPYIVASFSEQGVSVRALIVPTQARDHGDSGPIEAETWQITLERRETRAGAHEAELVEGVYTFTAPAGVGVHILARHAKKAAGIPGWPAQRQGDSMTWHLARAPYRFTIQRIDTLEP